jgi:hypothetical protein
MWILGGIALAVVAFITYAVTMKDPEDEFLDVHEDDEW